MCSASASGVDDNKIIKKDGIKILFSLVLKFQIKASKLPMFLIFLYRIENTDGLAYWVIRMCLSILYLVTDE